MEQEKQTFASRFKKPAKQWIKATIWSIIYILFIVWVGNFWWLLLLPFIIDAFITKYIPWSWWKDSKNKTVRSVMSWVDAIVFALVAVYFIHTFLFQNYQIPTSSLEKSLLVGDFLLVSKADYGPRVPMTPLSFPLVQHTFPVINVKSYIEHPQWDYRRLKGLTSLKRDDIVVFNFPAGDTVATKKENPDYYTLCYENGRDAVWSQKQIYGDIVYRPVDRRENYVKRCVGVAGDTLQIINNQVIINGKPQQHFPGIEYNYFVQTDGSRLSTDFLEKLGVSNDDIILLNNYYYAEDIANLGMNVNYPVYHFPLTQEMYSKLQKTSIITKIVQEPANSGGEVYPLGYSQKWNWSRGNYGPIYIPKKGTTVILDSITLPLYSRIITNYEHNKLEEKGGKVFINGKETNKYTFQMDYFWMMGDNRDNSADSRFWGFVPEDHIVGRPLFVWLSLNKDKGWFSGKIRWDRFFKNAER